MAAFNVPEAGEVDLRIYDAAGDSLGPAFDLYLPPVGESAFDPSVSIDSAGNFVVAWRGADCVAPCVGSRMSGQLFDRRGEPQGVAVEVGQGRDVLAEEHDAGDVHVRKRFPGEGGPGCAGDGTPLVQCLQFDLQRCGILHSPELEGQVDPSFFSVG